VHAHDLNTLIAGALAARSAGARLVYDSHELNTATSYVAGNEPCSLPSGAGGRRARSTVGRHDHGQRLVRGNPRDRVWHLPAPRRQQLPRGGAAPSAYRRLAQSVRIASGRRIAVYHGSLAPNPRRRRADRGRSVQRWGDVVFLGDGPYVAQIPRFALLNGVEEHVHVGPAVPLSDLPPSSRRPTSGSSRSRARSRSIASRSRTSCLSA
jgi:hypothetical protein